MMFGRYALLACPEEFLGKPAEDEWEKLAGHVAKMGLLTEETRPRVIAGVAAHARYLALGDYLQEQGWHTEDEDGNPTHRPEYREWLRASVEFMDFAQNFGLTPLGRQKIAERGGTPGTKKTDFEAEFPPTEDEEV